MTQRRVVAASGWLAHPCLRSRLGPSVERGRSCAWIEGTYLSLFGLVRGRNPPGSTVAVDRPFLQGASTVPPLGRLAEGLLMWDTPLTERQPIRAGAQMTREVSIEPNQNSHPEDVAWKCDRDPHLRHTCDKDQQSNDPE